MESDIKVGDRVEGVSSPVVGTVAYIAKEDGETTVVQWDNGRHQGFFPSDVKNKIFSAGEGKNDFNHS